MKWSYIEKMRHALAREHGAIVKDWGGKLAVALIYPNTYQVGMSSLGFQTIYRLFNACPDIVCERVFWQAHFAPDDPILSVETQRRLADFDLLAFSVSFEMDYPHIVELLRRADIPLRADQRWYASTHTGPPIIAGGPAVSANPLPLADFIDAFVIGEAEPIFDLLARTLRENTSRMRDTLWEALSQVPGVYVPHLTSTSPGDGPPGILPPGILPSTVERQWVHHLDDYPTSTIVHTPDTTFGNMHLIEISRGCGRGCRFCMAGFTTRPKREYSTEVILRQAQTGLTHISRIGLVGAAVSDYSHIDELAIRLRKMNAQISVSSLRVDPLSESLLQALAESGAQTLTLAPEAGSERLRQVINKNVTEADLLDATERAAHYRFRQLKLYFMIGLPTETDQDIDAIASLCDQVAARFSSQITVNVTPFVPKAHTPFQWLDMAPIHIIEARLARLKSAFKRRRIDLRSESPQWAEIQGLLARGDRRLGQVLASLQGTSTKAWAIALQNCEIDPLQYLTWHEHKPLPWAFISPGVSVAYLKREFMRAQTTAPTAPCPLKNCSQCEVCEGNV